MRVELDDLVILTEPDGSPLNPRGTRYDTDDLDTIATIGQLFPIAVLPPTPDGKYTLLDGHRRVKWLRQHGYTSVEAEITLWDGHPADYMLATYTRKQLKPSQMGRALLSAKRRGHTTVTLAALMGIKSRDVDTYCALVGMEPTIIGKADAGTLTLSAVRDLITAPPAVREKVAARPDMVTAGTVRSMTATERGGVGKTDYLLQSEADPAAEATQTLRGLAQTATPQQVASWHAQLAIIMNMLEARY